MSGRMSVLACVLAGALVAAACSPDKDERIAVSAPPSVTSPDVTPVIGNESSAAPSTPGDSVDEPTTTPNEIATSTVAVAPADTVAAAVTTGNEFLDTFDGAPATPLAWSSANWEVSAHSRDFQGEAFEEMEAQHGMDCSAPPATHTVSAFEDAVYSCKDHLMTAINAEGYGLVYLTPDHMVDFSAGEAVVSFDVSTALLSTRDWWDLWISPYDEHLQLAGEDWYPDLQGQPRSAVHVKLETFDTGESGFSAAIYEGFQRNVLPGETSTPVSELLTPDFAERTRFELRISRGHLRFGAPDYGFWWVDTAIDELDWDRGVVQFGHHSYNPTKDDKLPNALPNTWHWDNVSIAPARQFTIIHADQRQVTDSTTVVFSAPAPDDSMLRFAGFGENLEFSVDGGATWTAAKVQPHGFPYDPYHHASYWTPVPAGTTEVEFRGSEDWEWSARDITIWSTAAP